MPVAIDTRSAHDRPFFMVTDMPMTVCHVDSHAGDCEMSIFNADSQKCTWSRYVYLPLLQMPTTFEHTKIVPATRDKNPNNK